MPKEGLAILLGSDPPKKGGEEPEQDMYDDMAQAMLDAVKAGDADALAAVLRSAMGAEVE